MPVCSEIFNETRFMGYMAAFFRQVRNQEKPNFTEEKA